MLRGRVAQQRQGQEAKIRMHQKPLRETKKRFVLNTFGSLGDLHPYLALALELRKRGHLPAIAANATHRSSVEAEGLALAISAMSPRSFDKLWI